MPAAYKIISALYIFMPATYIFMTAAYIFMTAAYIITPAAYKIIPSPLFINKQSSNPHIFKFSNLQIITLSLITIYTSPCLKVLVSGSLLWTLTSHRSSQITFSIYTVSWTLPAIVIKVLYRKNCFRKINEGYKLKLSALFNCYQLNLLD